MGSVSALAIVSDHIEGTRCRNCCASRTNAACRSTSMRRCASSASCRRPWRCCTKRPRRAHGLIAPERLGRSRAGRLVIVEHVLGAAVEQLHYGRDRLWLDFRVGMPPPRHRALRPSLRRRGHRPRGPALCSAGPSPARNFPPRFAALLDETYAPHVSRRGAAARRHARLDGARAATDVGPLVRVGLEATAALEDVLAGDALYVAAPFALETFSRATPPRCSSRPCRRAITAAGRRGPCAGVTAAPTVQVPAYLPPMTVARVQPSEHQPGSTRPRRLPSRRLPPRSNRAAAADRTAGLPAVASITRSHAVDDLTELDTLPREPEPLFNPTRRSPPRRPRRRNRRRGRPRRGGCWSSPHCCSPLPAAAPSR